MKASFDDTHVKFEIPVIPPYIEKYFMWCYNKGYSVNGMLNRYRRNHPDSIHVSQYPAYSDELVFYLTSRQPEAVIAYISKSWKVEEDLYFARIKGAAEHFARDNPTYLKRDEKDKGYELVYGPSYEPDEMTKEDWEFKGITENIVDFEPIWEQ